MVLKCKAFVIKIFDTCQSPAFEDLKVQDIIEFSVDTNEIATNFGGWDVVFNCRNLRTGAKSIISYNNIKAILNIAEFKELP